MSLDSWLLFTESIWKAFKGIGEVLEAELPLEVAVGVKEFHESPAGKDLIELRNETMSYLKNNILSHYKLYMKKEHGVSIHETFILLTEYAYKELDSKKICYKINKLTYHILKMDDFKKILIILKFLDKIGSQRAEYRNIDDLYVEPENYYEIEKILKNNNVVFIIGDPEMGKTYTAMKFLFEFFKKGYEPVYYPEEKWMEQWEFVRHDFELEGKAVYLEDPWGKVEFKAAESLFRDIGELIREARRKNCKVIITSREKVFNEFEKRKEIADDLPLSRLKVGLAYTESKLRVMLENYITVFEPKWRNDEELKTIAYEAIGKELRTPMSIRVFIKHMEDAADEKNLKLGIKNASKETKIAFAREITEIFNKEEYDKLVFLSFPYIFVDINTSKQCYYNILKYLNYNLLNAKDFEDLLNEFSGEVEISFGNLKYVHPSYWDAFKYALAGYSKQNNISKKIFFPVLLKLSEQPKITSWAVAEAVVRNFDKLPEEGRNLIIRLSERPEVARYVARAVAKNFDKIPDDFRSILILKLSEQPRTARHVARIIVENYAKLSPDVRCLLFELSTQPKTAKTIVKPVVQNFDKLPEDVRYSLLLKFFEKSDFSYSVANAIIENFEKLPEDVRKLLFRLSEEPRKAVYVASAVARYFEKLPEDVRKLLFRLSEEPETARHVAWAVAQNFDKLPEEVRNSLLLKLSDQSKASKGVAWTVAYNFDKLPEDVRNILFRLTEQHPEATMHVAWAIAGNFDKLPQNVRNLLFDFSEQPKKARYVAHAIAKNFNRLPEDVQKILYKLCENPETAKYAAWAISQHFNKLHESERNILLLKLSEQPDTAMGLARSITKNFDKLPNNIIELLFKFSDVPEAALPISGALLQNFDKIPEDVRNSLLRKLSDQPKTARFLVTIIAKNYDKLEANERSLLFKFSENPETARYVARALSQNFNKIPDFTRDSLLLKLSGKPETALHIARIVIGNFSKLPEAVRSTLLYKLSEESLNKLPEQSKITWHLARIIVQNFDEIPLDIRNVMFKLSEQPNTAKYVVSAIAHNFEKLPENIRGLLFKLSENPKTAYGVASAIAKNFDRLPEDARNLLDKLQEELQSVIKDSEKRNKIDSIELISKVSTKIDKSFVLNILEKLSNDKNITVAAKAKTLIDVIQGKVN